MALRDAIKAKHDEAESHRFVKLLLSGYMPPTVYADLLINQAVCYSKLEKLASDAGLLTEVETIARARLIESDYENLGKTGTVKQSTHDYVEYLDNIPTKDLMAHIYVRHFGDMYGGQMLKKVVPGSAAMYDFEDRAGLIAKVRERLTDDLGDEANRAFEFNIRLFDEIADAHDIRTA
jgi:heme oxygenase